MTVPTIISRLPLGAVLRLDALTSGAMGILLLAAGGMLAPVLGLPEGLLRGAGLVLLPFAAFVLHAARGPAPSAVRVVIGLNLAWVAASLVLLVSGLVAPSIWGDLLIIAQAMVVALFALLQANGLRRPALAAG